MLNRRALGIKLREQALRGSGRIGLAALLEAMVPVERMRELARTHGLSPKGGYRVDTAPARVLAPVLAEPISPVVLEQVCNLLAECMTAPLRDDDGALPVEEAPDLAPIVRLKEQELEHAKGELEKGRQVAQGLRARVDELTRAAEQDQLVIVQLRKELASVRAQLDAFPAVRPAENRDQASRIQALERELEEQGQVELQHRIQAAEQAALLREREERIRELEELVPQGSRRKRREPPPPPERFIVPHFTPGFLKSLQGRDRRAIEHAYRAVFLYCTEGPQYPGLQVKSLDPSGVWSLRAALKLRVYFRPRPDGDIDVLELLDRQEQMTALRRYREKS